MENITSVDKETWIQFFKQNNLPTREDLNYTTVEEWRTEYNKTKSAYTNKELVIKQLKDNNDVTLKLNNHQFNDYLTLLNSLNVKTEKWLEDSDDVTEDFLTLIKDNPVLSHDIYITRPDVNKRGYFLEFDNYISDCHISTFIIIQAQKLNQFLFIGFYSDLFTL